MGFKRLTKEPVDRFANCLTQTRGSAPLIGVILLLVLTTVTASLIASVVFGMGLVPTPIHMVDWEFEMNESNVVVKHDGGPTLDGTQVVVTGIGITESETLASVGPSTWSPGTQAEIPVYLDSNTSVKLIWNAPTGGQILLSRWSPPTEAIPTNTTNE